MYQQKIAKHLIELNKTDPDNTFSAVTVREENASSQFFRFVDKNPLFADNSANAIYDFLVSSRERQFKYGRRVSGNHGAWASHRQTDDVFKG